MQFADLHSHTVLCKHANGTPDEYLAEAVRKGVAYLGVSDHIPWPAAYDTEVRMDPLQFPMYRWAVSQLQKLAEKTPVKVLYGIEMDYVPNRMDEVYDAIKDEPFDYRLGSIHYVDFGFDNPEMISVWEAKGAPWVWNNYAEKMCEFVESCSFEIMAHPDLPKVFGIYPEDCQPFITRMRDAFRIAGEKGIAIELNTAGLRKKVHEIYPSLALLKLAREAGMPITFGSDSHRPEDIASGFDQALELAKAAGYRSALTFVRRQKIELSFD